VRGIDLLRDPMSVIYGSLMGGLVQIDSKPGDEHFKMGVQGFVPRPRFTNPGAGRLEGLFPRIYAGGATRRARHIVAAEWDFERIPVPEVTQGDGPNVVEQSGIVFMRTDLSVSTRDTLTLEGLVLASGRDSESLSPRRDDQAAADTRGKDYFIGVTNRFILDPTNVLTVRFGAFDREASLTPRGGAATSLLSPEGWSGTWFSHMSRRASRVGLTITSEQSAVIKAQLHEFTMAAGLFSRQLTGSVTERPILVVDALGRKVRTVGFGPGGGTDTAALDASDRPAYIAARDVWHASERLQIDGGMRVDYNGSHGPRAPSARVGLRLGLDASEVTILKAGYGSFVGDLPLLVQAFGAYPVRTDTQFDPATGATIGTPLSLQPTIRDLRQPRAVALSIGVERQLRPGLDAQVSVTERNSIRLATLEVLAQSGPLTATSSGTGRYQELQLSVRRRFERDQQIFVSYVRSDAKGELNDFSTQVQGFDAPLVQPGGRARLSTDAPHRVIAWGTFNLPRGIVVSPVTEWHSGFPYSSLNDRYLYAGTPHDQDFPAFVATDLIIYKNFTYRNRSADLGIQLFNATNHSNPRDVNPVVGTARFGEFSNSVGTILRGFMMLKW
jgi:hypothetical protein